jgi:hypothetical protein
MVAFINPSGIYPKGVNAMMMIMAIKTAASTRLRVLFSIFIFYLLCYCSFPRYNATVTTELYPVEGAASMV